MRDCVIRIIRNKDICVHFIVVCLIMFSVELAVRHIRITFGMNASFEIDLLRAAQCNVLFRGRVCLSRISLAGFKPHNQIHSR